MSLEESSPLYSTHSAASVDAVATEWNAQLPQVVAITEEMFGEIPTVQTMSDPEEPEAPPFALIHVQSRESTQELTQRHIEWGRRLDAIGAGLQYRLSIVPVS